MKLIHIDKIVTERREFPLKDVFDLSFRKIGTEGGILFIHTNHGVYSYTVTSSPLSFIHTCKSYLMYKKAFRNYWEELSLPINAALIMSSATSSNSYIMSYSLNLLDKRLFAAFTSI